MNQTEGTVSAVDHSTENAQLVRRWVDEFANSQNASAVDELLAPGYVVHPLHYHPYMPSSLQAGSWTERIKRNVGTDIMGIQNCHTVVDQLIASGDRVVLLATTTGTRRGTRVSYTGISILRCADGRIVEGWGLWDRLGVYQQLGIVPETPELMKQVGLEP